MRLKDWNTKPIKRLRSSAARFSLSVAYLHPVEQVLATVVVVEDAEDVEQGRLARTGCAHNRHQFATSNLEVDVFEHMQRYHAGVGLVYIA